jgi:sn-glycerol 3-phosphate transport system permease protein
MKNQSNKKKPFCPAPYLFLLPCMVVFVLFIFYPFVKTIVFSFFLTDFRGQAREFVGFENYITQFGNTQFRNSLKLTLTFAPMIGFPTLIGAYLLAALAHDRILGSRLFEMMYSIPMACASVPVAAIWVRLLAPGKYGMLNHLLGTEIRWLLDPKYALPSVALVTVWLQIGISFIFLLTGFRNVPDELIESARIDGAGYFKRLFKIITPIASPQIFFVVFLNIVSSFQAFSQIRTLTYGGPSYSTTVLVYSIYISAIQNTRFETAFVQSNVLFLIILIITFLQFRTEKRMVHYQ